MLNSGINVQKEPAVMDAPSEVGNVCEALSDILLNGRDVHRCFAAKALGEIADPQAVDSLIKALLDEDEDVRTDVATALAQICDPRSADQLLENLIGDPCNGVKIAAIDALVSMKSGVVVPWLRRLLAGRDEEINWDETDYFMDGWDDWVDIQAKSVEALGSLGIEEAVPEIVAAMEDEEGQDLTEIGFKALVKLGEPGAAALVAYLDSRDEKRRRRVAALLGGLTGSVVDGAVSRALSDPSAQVRLAVVKSLAAEDPVDARLAAVFGDASSDLRAAAIRLCGIHHPDLVEDLLVNGSFSDHAAIFELLAAAPDLLSVEDVIEHVQTALNCKNSDVASAAIAAYARLAPQQAHDELLTILADKSQEMNIRLASLHALAEVPLDEKTTLSVTALLMDEHRELRMNAMSYLAAEAGNGDWPNLQGDILLDALNGDIVPAPLKEETEPSAESSAQNQEIDTDHGQSGKASENSDPDTQLAEQESDSDSSEDLEAEEAGEPAFPVSTLAAILGQESPHLAAVQARGKNAELSPSDLEFLGLAKRTPRKRRITIKTDIPLYQDVPRFAARVLGNVAHADVALALSEKFSSDDNDLSAVAADSLVQIGHELEVFSDDVFANLRAALSMTDLQVQRNVVRALGVSGHPDASKTVAACLQNKNSFIRTEAVQALSNFDDTERDIVPMLQDEDATVRLAAAKALAAHDTNGTVDQLVEFAFDFKGYHRREAGRLLRKTNIQDANDRLVDVLNDAGRESEWQVAIESLEELNGLRVGAA